MGGTYFHSWWEILEIVTPPHLGDTQLEKAALRNRLANMRSDIHSPATQSFEIPLETSQNGQDYCNPHTIT